MKTRMLAGGVFITMVLSLVVGFVPVSADGPPPVSPPPSMAVAGPEPMDLTVEMLGEEEIAMRKHAAWVGSALATNASPIGAPAVIGDEYTITVSDDGLGVDYDETFVVVLDGTYGIILIEKAAYDSYDGTNYTFPNPNGCWRDEDVISHAQLQYLLNEFDNNIYSTVAEVLVSHCRVAMRVRRRGY